MGFHHIPNYRAIISTILFGLFENQFTINNSVIKISNVKVESSVKLKWADLDSE